MLYVFTIRLARLDRLRRGKNAVKQHPEEQSQRPSSNEARKPENTKPKPKSCGMAALARVVVGHQIN